MCNFGKSLFARCIIRIQASWHTLKLVFHFWLSSLCRINVFLQVHIILKLTEHLTMFWIYMAVIMNNYRLCSFKQQKVIFWLLGARLKSLVLHPVFLRFLVNVDLRGWSLNLLWCAVVFPISLQLYVTDEEIEIPESWHFRKMCI